MAGQIRDMEKMRLLNLSPDPLAGSGLDACGRSYSLISVQAGVTPAVQSLEPEKQGRSRKIRGDTGLMHVTGAREKEERQRKEGAEERKRITVGGASSEADLVGCQFKHGSFLPKKVP